MTDLELARQCIEGSKGAQQEVFDRHSRLMMSVCLRYADSREEARDILQEGFIKVYQRMDQYEGRGPLGAWMRSIMVSTSLNYIRQTKKLRNNTDVEAAEELETGDPSALETMSANELMDLIGQMPTGYRTVFNLFAIEGYAHKEIAELLGITESTSKTQFHKAKSWLVKAVSITEKTT